MIRTVSKLILILQFAISPALSYAQAGAGDSAVVGGASDTVGIVEGMPATLPETGSATGTPVSTGKLPNVGAADGTEAPGLSGDIAADPGTAPATPDAAGSLDSTDDPSVLTTSSESSNSFLPASSGGVAPFYPLPIPPQTLETALNHVASTGAFQYTVELKIPAFRGLEPALALNYNSADKSLGTTDPIVGVGWSLSGISSIRRVSVGGGIPSYQNTKDIFTLDGQDLLACVDETASEPFNRSYPDSYKADNPGASCVADGQFVKRREDFERIQIDRGTYEGHSVDRFTVTAKSGTKYVYKAVGELADIGSQIVAGDDRFDFAFRRKFMLHKIIDKQEAPNEITFTYEFGGLAQGLAERISKIEYGNGYKIKFLYGSDTDEKKRVAIGHRDIFAVQNEFLQAVTVEDSGSGIRAYQLTYERAPSTRQRRLVKVKEFGSDFQVDGKNYVTGSPLPPFTFSYNNGKAIFEIKNFALSGILPGGPTAFNFLSQTFDLDQDGRNEVHTFSRTHLAEPTKSAWVIAKTNLRFTPQRDVVDARPLDLPATLYQEVGPSYTGNPVESVRNIIAVSPETDLQDDTYLFSVTNSSQYNDSVKTLRLHQLSKGLDDNASEKIRRYDSGHCELGDERGKDPLLVGNFDKDPAPEVLFAERVYDLTGDPDAEYISYGDEAGGLSTYCDGTAARGAAAADIDGDGIDEIITESRIYWKSGEQAFEMKVVADDSTPDEYKTPFKSEYAFTDTGDEQRAIRFGDLNGDGAADAIVFTREQRLVSVRLSTGAGFRSDGVWLRSEDIPEDFLEHGYGSSRTTLADVNNDGLDDLILHDGMPRAYSLQSSGQGTPTAPEVNEIPRSKSAYIYLSTGTDFVKYVPDEDDESWRIKGFLGVGDFDGDGQLDLLGSEEAYGGDGLIYFGDGGPRSLLTKVVTPMGGATLISYSSTANGEDGDDDAVVKGDKIPGTTHIVQSIALDDGRGNTSQLGFKYRNGRYDYETRKNLGYETVTIEWPKIFGEAEGPVTKITHYNDHVGRAGLIRERDYSFGGQSQHTEINSWSLDSLDVENSGNGPFAALKIQVVEKTRHGDGEMIKTAQTYEYTKFGEPSVVGNLGVVKSEAGDDATTEDNLFVHYDYSPNTDKYIVSKPYKVVTARNDDFSNKNAWLAAERYSYDGGGVGDAPTRGNTTEIEKWDADSASNPSWRRSEKRGYDAYGNVIETKDAKNRVTAYTFDQRGLFKTSEMNAEGHTTTFDWNKGCQTVLKTVDPNGHETRESLDENCRKSAIYWPDTEATAFLGTNVPGVTFSYENFGDPENQYVKTLTLSASASVHSDHTQTRTYFDGLGRSYLTGHSGELTGPTGGNLDFVGILSSFDDRGNLRWQSKPLSWPTATGGSVDSDKGTTYWYDPLDRVTQSQSLFDKEQSSEDGRYSTTTTSYGTENDHGGVVYYATTTVKDAHCYDSADAETVCGTRKTIVGPQGNVERVDLYDNFGVDTDGDPDEWRSTSFTYDRLGRLKKVEDPGQNTWRYAYDGFGNRSSVEDPSLGTWTMTYDEVGNLLSRTDAKNQEIAFTYDGLNRVTAKLVTDGAGNETTITYEYDENRAWDGYSSNIGFLTKITGGSDVIRYDYDAMGRLVRDQYQVGGGRNYTILRAYRPEGSIKQLTLPDTPNSTDTDTTRVFKYDAANRLIEIENRLTEITYDLWDNPTKTKFNNGIVENREYHPGRGWLERIEVKEQNQTDTVLDYTIYKRTQTGRIHRQRTLRTRGDYDYSYDYAGRLTEALHNESSDSEYSFKYKYDKTGRIQNVKTANDLSTELIYRYYGYSGTDPVFAPRRVYRSGESTGGYFLYDKNGNMTKGLDGKVMTYDGENRLTSVDLAGDLTSYAYWPDGSRKWKIETEGGQDHKTIYFAEVEIRHYQEPDEQVITYPHPSYRLVNGTPDYIHSDHLGSLRLMVDRDGEVIRENLYKPFGELSLETGSDGLELTAESIGFIGERYDANAGLQYLNARYYDPALHLFVSPDWLDVTEPGVGTNRLGELPCSEI